MLPSCLKSDSLLRIRQPGVHASNNYAARGANLKVLAKLRYISQTTRQPGVHASNNYRQREVQPQRTTQPEVQTSKNYILGRLRYISPKLGSLRYTPLTTKYP